VPWWSVAQKTRGCVPSPFEIIFSSPDLSYGFQIALRQNGDKQVPSIKKICSFKCLGLVDNALAKIFCSRILTMLWFLQTVVRVKGRPIWSKYNSKTISRVKWFCQEYGQTVTTCYLCRPLPPSCPNTVVIMTPWLHMNLFVHFPKLKTNKMTQWVLIHKHTNCNITWHTPSLGLSCGWNTSWRELKHLVRPDVLL
jgi:hypothetical protein